MTGRIEGPLRPLALLLAGLLSHLPIATPARAASCVTRMHDGIGYIVCEVAPGEDLRVWHSGPGGELLGSFGRIDALLKSEGRRLGLAMNGGMYHRDRSPVGLLVVEGREEKAIVTSAGPGNFGMLPNGVFCVGEKGFRVIESRAYAQSPPACRYATQSGPMLVIGGELHPRFLPDSDSRYVRNGIGVTADGRALLAISESPVTFHEFARLFRDGLGAPDALYLDGSISRLYAPAIGRNDVGFPMGPVIGLAVPADPTGPQGG